MVDTFFTTKVANQKSFCNREAESQLLIANLMKNQHTVVVAPRRYGKTSLIMRGLEKMDRPFAYIDLFCIVYEEDVCKKVAKGISSLIKEIASLSEKTIQIIQQSFKSVFVGLRAGQIELGLELANPFSNPIVQLEDLLNGLEKFAKKHKKHVVLFFDEFQDLLKVDETNKIQAAIRGVAQHSQYVTYVFSGSSRVMLNKIFDDKNQPLYMLCSKMLLNRISKEHFIKHIQKAAQGKWKKFLSNKIVEEILLLTESHPYYVNLLCDKLWNFDITPEIRTIQDCWEEALLENKGKVIADLEGLNANRTKVMKVVALFGPIKEPNSQDFLDKVKLSLSSTQHTIQYLLNHDYLYQDQEGLKVVDPLIKKFIVDRYR